ncbi:MAG: heme o synthase [Hyphomicrobiales bacterium]
MSDTSYHIATGRGLAASTGGSVADYFALMKPRVMSLVIFTALTAIVCAPGGMHPVLALAALLCIAVGAGASGALNMWYDADIDAEMTRTANRPLPRGRITREEAFTFGMVLSVLSVGCLGMLVNWASAALLALTITFYVVIYTMWLKRRTPQNIVIGGASGAFPPMIGWAAATGSLSIEPLLMFAIIFMWTPPHFWALALYRSRDYARAGVPMLPVAAGDAETRRQILLYSLLLVPLACAPAFIGFGGAVYAVASVLLGAMFLWLAFGVWRDAGRGGQERAARRLFAFSIFYLFMLFAVLLAEHAAAPFLGRWTLV